MSVSECGLGPGCSRDILARGALSSRREHDAWSQGNALKRFRRKCGFGPLLVHAREQTDQGRFLQ